MHKIWINTYLSYNQQYAKDLLYKFVHYAIETNNFVFIISRDKTDLTPNCNHWQMTEDNIHLFTACNRVKESWRTFNLPPQKLTKRKHTPQQHIFTLSANNLNSKNKKLILTLTQVTMYERWISRNNIKYDKT